MITPYSRVTPTHSLTGTTATVTSSLPTAAVPLSNGASPSSTLTTSKLMRSPLHGEEGIGGVAGGSRPSLERRLVIVCNTHALMVTYYVGAYSLIICCFYSLTKYSTTHFWAHLVIIILHCVCICVTDLLVQLC